MATAWSDGACEMNGVRIRYVRTGGAKPPVVLLHGLMGSAECWTPLARALEGQFDVVMPDARGHGGSSAPESGYTYDDHANDVLALIEALELEHPVVLGHSMGGMTAAVAARHCAENPRGLVFVDPTFIDPARQREVWESNVVDQHRRALTQERSALIAEAQSKHPQRSSEIIGYQVDARLATRSTALEVLAPPNPDYIDLVRAIDVPSLLVIGDSPVVSFELATELGTLNPRLVVEVISNAGHGLPFDQPERLSRAVKSFLSGLI